MRIQHNIMAMNAYRNYSNNTSALSKNLERLSSGYKINRAGDDAAGLAISEKMRAQISGLEAAQKNVKDGVSLVNTAEGAMQEIQDMLNRMVSLATQSANGTYDNEVDRKNLQAEVEQLKSEINRIADSANFNGIKLLDGSLDGSTDAVDAANAAAANVKAVYGDPADTVGLMLEKSTSNDPTSATDGVGMATILETDGDGEIVPSFKVSLNGITHVIDNPAGTDTLEISIDDGGTGATLSVTEAQIVAATDAAAVGDKVSSADLAKAIVAQTGNTTVTLDGITYDVTADGENLVFTAQSNPNPYEEKNAHFEVSFTSNVTGQNVAAAASTYTTGALTGTGTAAAGDSTVFTVAYTDADGNEQTKDITIASDAAATATSIADALIDAINDDEDLSALFTASGSDAGIVMTANTAGADQGAVSAITVRTQAAGIQVAIAADPTTAGAQVEGADAFRTGTDGYSNFGTQDIKVNVAGTKDELASTTLDLTGLLKDGTKITLGDKEYIIAVGPDSKFANADGATVVKVNEGATEEQIASALTDAADSNGTFTVGHETGTAKITLKQLAEVKESTDMSTMDKFASYISIEQVDTEATEKLQAEADKAAADAAAKQGTAMKLQIGDTSDDYNQLEVSVKDMHTTSLGIDDLDISTPEGASAAINIVKNAINTVSAVRGTLGAISNRLDHTANNLSVMTENITDAESTIRDTDIAEEMMAYTKNNILVQSAQAMLAQANQVPQGVLQLLQ